MSVQKNNNLKLWYMENGCRVTKPLSSLCVCGLWSEASLTSSSVVHDDANYCSCETCCGQFLQRSLKQTEVFLSSATRRWKTASHPRWHQGSFLAAAINMYHKCKNLLMVWESYNRNGPAERPPVGERRSAICPETSSILNLKCSFTYLSPTATLRAESHGSFCCPGKWISLLCQRAVCFFCGVGKSVLRPFLLKYTVPMQSHETGSLAASVALHEHTPVFCCLFCAGVLKMDVVFQLQARQTLPGVILHLQWGNCRTPWGPALSVDKEWCTV